MDKLKALLVGLCLTLAVTTGIAASTRLVILFPRYYKVIEEYHYDYTVGSGEQVHTLTVEAHSTIYQYRWIDGNKHLIFSYSHPAAMPSIGENFTAMKISGDAAWPFADEGLNNVTFIALGTDVGLGASSTVLAAEWNRTGGSFEYLGVGNWNYSASFFPSGSGSTNATSLNWKTGIGTDDCMWAYDTFTTITYTSNDQIDVEWEIDVQYT